METGQCGVPAVPHTPYPAAWGSECISRWLGILSCVALGSDTSARLAHLRQPARSASVGRSGAMLTTSDSLAGGLPGSVWSCKCPAVEQHVGGGWRAQECSPIRDVGPDVDVAERTAPDLPPEAVLVPDPELHDRAACVTRGQNSGLDRRSRGRGTQIWPLLYVILLGSIPVGDPPL